MKELQLKGTIPAQLKQLERVITRMLRKQVMAKTIVERPASVISHYLEESPKDGLLFLGGLFKGTVRKVLCSAQVIEGEGVPKYLCTVGNETQRSQVSVNSKKKVVLLDVNLDVKDGDLIKLEMKTPGIILRNVVITALVEFDKGLSGKTEIDTDSLLDNLLEIDYEGI